MLWNHIVFHKLCKAIPFIHSLARVPNSISQPILDIPSVSILISQMYVDMLQDSLPSVHNSFRFLQRHL